MTDNKDQIATLNTLIATTIDSITGYEDSAANIDNERLRETFRFRDFPAFGVFGFEQGVQNLIGPRLGQSKQAPAPRTTTDRPPPFDRGISKFSAPAGVGMASPSASIAR